MPVLLALGVYRGCCLGHVGGNIKITLEHLALTVIVTFYLTCKNHKFFPSHVEREPLLHSPSQDEHGDKLWSTGKSSLAGAETLKVLVH